MLYGDCDVNKWTNSCERCDQQTKTYIICTHTERVEINDYASINSQKCKQIKTGSRKTEITTATKSCNNNKQTRRWAKKKCRQNVRKAAQPKS